MLGSDLLESFVNGALRERLSSRGVAEQWTSEPAQVALLYVDVSGFTRVGERLATRGAQGAEQLTAVLESIFQPIIETVDGHGGDVLGFSGDSITAIWSPGPDQTLDEAAARAVHCGLLLREGVPRLDAMVRYRLDLRAGVTCGEGRFLELGGHDGRWVFVLGGDPTAQIAETVGRARPREVVVSPTVWELVAPLAQGVERDGMMSIRLMSSPPRWTRRTTPDVAVGSPAAAYLPEPVMYRLESGAAMSELRLISTVFVNLHGLAVERDTDLLALQRAVAAWQRILALYEGVLDKVSIDDKGATMIGTFGLPPRAHEDDAVRASAAALAMTRDLMNSRQEFGIGVATGRAFCGAYGSDLFRQYTTIGAVMNRAAALMQGAHSEALVDEETRVAAEERIKFSRQADLRLKTGRTTSAWRPLWERRPAEALQSRIGERAVATVGRQRELARLYRLIDDLVEADEPAAITIVGEPGIGKTRLLEEAASHAARHGVRPLVGVGDPILANAPYHGWQTIVHELLGLPPVASLAERQAAATEFLATLPDMEGLAPVLEPVLELGLKETRASANLSRSGRRTVISTVVSALLERAVADQPLMLLFDDAHWLDAASVALLEEAVPDGPVMVVLATRDEHLRPGTMPRLSGATTVTVRPNSLTQDEAVALATQTLGVPDVPEEVAVAIAERAAGNPLLTEQLAIAIREAQSDSGGPLRVPAELEPTNSVHGLVASRLDHLGPEAARLLKAASALGRSFSSGLLTTTLGGSDVAATQDEVDHLVAANLLSVGFDGSYAFRHALIQEAVYDMIPEVQRTAIHATAYQALVEGSSRQPALLAYQAERAGLVTQALDHLEAAGTDAVRRAASLEAISLFTRALALRGDPDPRPGRRAYWHSQLGVAHMDVGELERAHEELLRALAELRIRVPRRQVGVLAVSLVQSVIQAVHYLSTRLRRRERRARSPEQGYRLALAARVCSQIGEIHYFRADSLRFVLFNLMSINLAERSGHAGAGGLAFSSLSYLARVLRLRRVADAYNRASTAAEELKAATEAAGVDQRQVAMLPPHSVVAGGSRGSYQLCFAEWDAALASFDEAVEACQARRDIYQLEIIQALRGQALAMIRTISEACDEFRALHASSVARHNPEHLAWALALGTPMLFEAGAAEEARRWAGEIEEAMPAADPATRPILHAVWADASLRAGRHALAVEQAVASLSQMSVSPIFPQLFGYTAALGVIHRLQAEGSELITPAVRRAERVALRRLRVFALTLPFGRPRAALLRGRSLAVRGKRRRACRVWRRGIELADRQGQRWDAARMWELAGRECRAGGGDAFSRARDLYAAVGARESLERLGASG